MGGPWVLAIPTFEGITVRVLWGLTPVVKLLCMSLSHPSADKPEWRLAGLEVPSASSPSAVSRSIRKAT